MPGMRKEIHKETSNCYGGTEIRAVVKNMEEHYTFRNNNEKDVPKDEVRINGMFARDTT